MSTTVKVSVALVAVLALVAALVADALLRPEGPVGAILLPDGWRAQRLVGRLTVSDPRVRAEAAAALSQIQRRSPTAAQRATPALVGLLADPDPLVRGSAVNALGMTGGAEAESALCGCLLDTDYSVSRAAMEALSTMGRTEATIPTLINALKGEDARARSAALVHLASVGEAAIAPLRACLQSESPATRVAALKVLGTSSPGGLRLAPDLVACLSDDDPAVRKAAASALNSALRAAPSCRAKAVPELIRCLEDPETRWEAMGALGACRAEAEVAVPRILDLLDDPDPVTRHHAAWALGSIGSRRATPRLVRCLADPDTEVRRSGAASLARLQDPSGTAALIDCLSDPDAQIRFHAAEGLGALGPRARHAEPELMKLLQDEEPFVQGAAARALESVPGSEGGDGQGQGDP